MKNILLLFTLIITQFCAKAQITEVMYFDEFSTEVDSSQAKYKVVYKYTDSTKLKFTSYHSRKDSVYKIVQGIKELQDTNLVFTGTHTSFFKNGSAKTILNYQKDRLHGTIKTFHENGQLKREDIFENDSLIAGKCYSSEGKDTTYFPYYTMASFPGGMPELMKFISRNVHYPEIALENGIQGTVYIRFIVDKFGCIEKTKVIKSHHWSFNKAAEKVIRAMPPWIPGIIDGEVVEMAMTAPIKFKIADDPPANKKALSEKELKKLKKMSKKYR